VARATRTGWVEEICRLAVLWRSSEKSLRELSAPALPHIDDRAAFIAAISGWLREQPDLIGAWQAYCDDKRTGRSPYFYFDGAWKVGFYESSVKELAERYRDERLYADAVDACADFIYREALWVLGRERAR
jgi:hypothetical protein